MSDVYLNPQQTYKLGTLFTPRRDSTGWFAKSQDPVGLIERLLPEELSQELLTHLLYARSPEIEGITITSDLAVGYIMGGRKYLLKFRKSDPKYSQLIRLINLQIKYRYPEMVDIDGNFLPDEIFLAVKGSGAKVFVGPENFKSTGRIYGYGAKDKADVKFSSLIAGKYCVDGYEFVIPHNRIHLAAIDIDEINYLDLGKKIRFSDIQNKEMRLATGENKLAISILIEPFGPDLDAVSEDFGITWDGESISLEAKVNYIRKNLASHPFFRDLCKQDLSAEVWVKEYLRTLVLYVYLRSRALADKILVGLNRTTQNSDLALEFRDLDDSFPIHTPFDLTTKDGADAYLLNYSRNLDCYMANFKVLVEQILGLDLTQLAKEFYFANPENIYLKLLNNKLLEFGLHDFDYLEEIKTGSLVFLHRVLGFGEPVEGVYRYPHEIDPRVLQPHVELNLGALYSLFDERFSSNQTIRRLSLSINISKFAANCLDPRVLFQEGADQVAAEMYLLNVIDLLWDQQNNLYPVDIIEVSEILAKSFLLKPFRTRMWKLSNKFKSDFINLYDRSRSNNLKRVQIESIFAEMFGADQTLHPNLGL